MTNIRENLTAGRRAVRISQAPLEQQHSTRRLDTTCLLRAGLMALRGRLYQPEAARLRMEQWIAFATKDIAAHRLLAHKEV